MANVAFSIRLVESLERTIYVCSGWVASGERVGFICFETVWGSSTCLQLKSVPPPRANWVLWDKKHSDVGNPLFSRETSEYEQALNGILGCHGSVREVRAVSGKRFLKEKPPDVLILNKSFLLAVVLQFRISWNERELPNELCWRSCSHDKPNWHY